MRYSVSQIPLGPLAACPNHRALWRVVKEMVEDTIVKRIGSTQEEEEEEEDIHLRAPQH